MRKKLLFFLIVLCAVQTYGQQLGFSSFSPLGGSHEESSHTMLYNTGEPMDEKHITDELTSNDGLLNNFNFKSNYNSFIKVTFFLDINENGVKDGDEVYLNLGAFTLQDSILYRNSFKEGVTLLTTPGTYTVKWDDLGALGFNLTTPSTFEIILDDTMPVASVSFGLHPDADYVEVNTFISSAPFRCGFKVNYQMVAVNDGYLPATGTAWLKIDERISNVKYIQEPDIVIDSNYVGWNYILQPSERQVFDYCLQAPLISDDVMLGDEFKTLSWTLSTIDDPNCLNQVLRCSYDPNDKLVNPDRPDSLGLLGDRIVYTIRFQNTGNDYAEDVVVTDTLSEFLDMSTFKLINTSHPKEFKIVNNKDDDHIINFTFENIYLQDSTTNEPASHGFIMYSIRPFDDVDEFTEINNTGHIYFDFNPAIVTNTTSTTLVETFPVDAVVDLNSLDLTITPNPTTGLTYFDKEVDIVTIYDFRGKLMRQFRNVSMADLSDMPSGTYLIEAILGDGHLIEKLVVIGQ